MTLFALTIANLVYLFRFCCIWHTAKIRFYLGVFSIQFMSVRVFVREWKMHSKVKFKVSNNGVCILNRTHAMCTFRYKWRRKQQQHQHQRNNPNPFQLNRKHNGKQMASSSKHQILLSVFIRSKNKFRWINQSG